MKGIAAVGAAAVLVWASRAAASEDVKSAADKLAEAESYSWTSTPKSDGQNRRFSRGPTEGKLRKDGARLLKLTFGERSIEAVIKGETVLVKSEEGWKSAEELRGEGGQGRRDPASFMARRLARSKAPADHVKDLLGGAGEVSKNDDGVFEGKLTEAGAQGLLFGGRQRENGPTVKDAAGSVKFWIEDGLISKYEYTLSGKVNFRDREFEINRSVTVEIKDVGKTEFELPEGAQEKLGG